MFSWAIGMEIIFTVIKVIFLLLPFVYKVKVHNKEVTKSEIFLIWQLKYPSTKKKKKRKRKKEKRKTKFLANSWLIGKLFFFNLIIHS